MKLKLTPKQRKEFVEALLACPTMKEWKSRETVVTNLPEEIKFNVHRHPDEYTDAYNIVGACYSHPKGMKILIDIMNYFEKDSKPMRKVNKLWQQYTNPMVDFFEKAFLVGAFWAILVYYALVTNSFRYQLFEVALFLLPTIAAVIGMIVVGYVAWAQYEKDQAEDAAETAAEAAEKAKAIEADDDRPAEESIGQPSEL